jgi:aldose sugar dehydrogenase
MNKSTKIFIGMGILALMTTTLALLSKEKTPSLEASAKAAEPTKMGQATQAINVTRLYNDTCAKCHGEQAEGGGGGTPSLLKPEKMDQKYDKLFFDATKEGLKDAGMDAYGPTMDDATIWALVVHIRELQNKGLEKTWENPQPDEKDGVYTSQRAKYKIETVVDKDKGLAVPWAIDWLPDGKMLITNRTGALRLSQNGEVGPPIENIPASKEIGQGGLMDVAVHPNYAKNGWVYLSLTDPSTTDSGAGMTKIVRGKLKIDGLKASWTNEQTIYQSKPETYSRSGVHYGCRIAFDKKGHVFFSHGERGSGEKAQDLTLPNGKIFRVNEDGTIPKDNPFVSDPKNIPAIWSYGHRNPQGLTFDLKGNLWDTEHGPRGGDEFNSIQKGANYGWPIIAASINYNDSPMSTPWPKPGQDFTVPILRWLPSIGPCGMDVMKGDAFPAWRGDIIAGGLALGGPVFRLRVQNGQVIEREKLIWRQGRVRETSVGPDGMLYIALNQPDKIIRLVPVK